MSEFVQITTTTGTREVAERIAVELVDRGGWRRACR